jgi:rhamnose utilization protein RhaD (predicted bifunctional aldolase and dehydrogenase)/NAD(P)-dependent dehydrogenase (short-subunit alcohol dehydrogenase family)
MATRTTRLRYLEDRWDDRAAGPLDGPDQLRYRSNLLGSDLRITNFGGGNTSSKLSGKDPVDGAERQVLWVKGSGGDLGSIQRSGFAALSLDRLRALRERYRGPEHEDELVELYPLCAFGTSSAPASIDTPLHGFLPFAHIDHLHPDWAIALAAAANGRERMEEFNRRFDHRLVWVPWRRPGFELAMMIGKAVEQNPGCDGLLLGGHGLFSWGETQRECYRSTLGLIDDLGQFVLEAVAQKGGGLFGGARFEALGEHRELAIDVLPLVRGQVSSLRRMIGHYSDLPEVLRFVNSADAERLARLGTSCPDHFIRTKIRPLFVSWTPSRSLGGLRQALEGAIVQYREDYHRYYRSFAGPGSPPERDPNPTVVLVPGLGMFSFGKSKTEARITGEFYVNAIHVMEGATALGTGRESPELPQAGAAAPASAFEAYSNYVSLPTSEAFRIEYWPLEEAKLRRQPPEKVLSRRIVVVMGGGSGIGSMTAQLAAERGAHLVVADRDPEGAQRAAEQAAAAAGKEAVLSVAVDVRDRGSIRRALRGAVAAFGGVDVVVNTAAAFQIPGQEASDALWATTLDVNVTANQRLADEVKGIFQDQDLEASLVLTSSANAVVPKQGSEAYDVSKAAVSHLVRELAVALAPRVRVNGVSPATVVSGSAMFPRERVIASLTRYGVAFDPAADDEALRHLLAEYYARRTLTHRPIEPADCARAILFLAGPDAPCTTGHILPVDGGLAEAFLR